MPAGHDGIGAKTKKAWRMKVKEHAGSRVGPKGGAYSKKARVIAPPKKPPRQKRGT